jgi:RNA-directed DNA polymerase
MAVPRPARLPGKRGHLELSAQPGERRNLIKQEIAADRFRFGVLDRIIKPDGSEIDLWTTCDALVLKALSIVLGQVLPVSSRCTHVKNHGGAKAAVRQLQAHLAENRFVLRTDVKSYYTSIDHVLLMDRLAHYTGDRTILSLCGQCMKRTYEQGDWFWSHDRGISLGCPLSPPIGAFFLGELDARMERSGLFYVRFMDDILVLAPTRASCAVRSGRSIGNYPPGASKSIKTKRLSARSSDGLIFWVIASAQPS